MRASINEFPSPQTSHEVRLGMLTPSSNTVLEPLCTAMLSGLPEVSLHFGRFRVTEISLSVSALSQFSQRGMLDAVALLADARPRVICWSGTSASWLGLRHDDELCAAITRETGVPATSAMLSLFDALRAAGCRRVGLVTPYTDTVQRSVMETLTAEGLTVVAERHLGIVDNFSFAGVSGTALTAMIHEVAAARPQAILVLCTNLRAAPIVDGLERALGLPLLDSVATAVWGALNLAGVRPQRVKGWGRLFDGFPAEAPAPARHSGP